MAPKQMERIEGTGQRSCRNPYFTWKQFSW